jgi:hypothetical protein
MTLGRAVRAGAAFATLLAVAVPSAFAEAKVSRNWVTDPAVVQIDTTADVYAIGDVHGDCDRLVTLLIGAKIVESDPSSPGKVRWSAGKSVLVFTGDIIDKGPKGPEVITLLRSLREQAAHAGGRVVVLAGNHEVDFLRDPGSSKAAEFATQLRRAGLDPKVIAACGGDVGAFFCGLPFAARVNKWFFAHAGNSGGRSLSELIADLQSGLERDGFATPQLTAADSLLQAPLGGKGASWFDAGKKKITGEQALAEYAAALGAAHIVQGHQHKSVRFPDGKTRKIGQIYQWRGRLFLIDGGMSREINDSAGAVLRIQPGEASVICPDGRTTKLWDEAKKPGASKGVRCAQ